MASLRPLVRVSVTVATVLLVAIISIKGLFTLPFAGELSTELTVLADAAHLRRHVEYLCEEAAPRSVDHPAQLSKAGDYILEQFAQGAGRLSSQPFEARGAQYRNVINSFGPIDGDPFVIGAHYDVFGELPGADDNASGVAVLLELSRLLTLAKPSHRIDLVAFANEEPPFFGSLDMGSSVHARSKLEPGQRIRGMISVEMVGYFTEDQPWGNWLLEAIYRGKGDFVMVAGRREDRQLIAYTKRVMNGATDLPVLALSAPSGFTPDASDHQSYWAEGIPAVILTDTATVRNPNYHTVADLPETLDYSKMAQVAEALWAVAMRLDHY